MAGSTDRRGGRTLLSWVRFELPWAAEAGEHLALRATDEIALQQPETVDWNAKGYQMNAIYEVPVTVSWGDEVTL